MRRVYGRHSASSSLSSLRAIGILSMQMAPTSLSLGFVFSWARGNPVAVEMQPKLLRLASPATEDAALGGAQPVLVIHVKASSEKRLGQVAFRTLMPVANFLDATSMSSRRSA